MDKAISGTRPPFSPHAPASQLSYRGISLRWHQHLKCYFTAHFMALKASFHNIAIAPFTTFLSIAAMGACLALPMGLYLLVKNVQHLSQGLEKGAALSLYVSPQSTPPQIEAILNKAKSAPYIKKITYLTPEQALAEFQQSSGLKDILALLPENPLPGVIHLQIDAKEVAHSTLLTLKNELTSMPGVEQASFDHEWVEKLQAFLALGKNFTQLLYFIIGFGVILMVGNTIRLALERHKDEIEVLNLMGATKAYIRRPFLYRGALYGGLGGLIASLIITLAVFCLSPYTSQLAMLYQSVFSLENLRFYDTVAMLFVSASLGWLGAAIAFMQQGRNLIPDAA